jgi:HEPN domain-containing protein
VPEDQNHWLAAELQHWLEIIDDKLSEAEVPLYRRALYAVLELCREETISIRCGDQSLDISDPIEHMDADWFRAIYAGVDHWYTQRFGANKVQTSGGRYLNGAIMIHRAAFGLKIKAHRTEMEVAGERAWLYFEDGIGDDEDPIPWLIDGPDLKSIDPDFRDAVVSDMRQVASSLRFIQFRSKLGDFGDDMETRKLSASCLTHLQKASDLIVRATSIDRGLAWVDLQMANEAALKSVSRRATGEQEKTHLLPDLLKDAFTHGVAFDTSLLANWPDFRTEISHWRYGQGHPPDLNETYNAYTTSLRLVRACMEAVPPKVQPGFGILMRYAPWKQRPNPA